MSTENAMRRFMQAEEYAVIGRVMSDPAKWDNKILKWYQTRNLKVTPIKPSTTDNEEIEGIRALADPLDLPNLEKTSLSVVLHPSKGLDLIKSLYPQGSESVNCPRAVWFQPGTVDKAVKDYVYAQNLKDRVILEGCVLVDGDALRERLGSKL